MIKILSINDDQTTNEVIDWLDYFQTSWSRLNSENIEDEVTLRLYDEKEDGTEVIWFRKWEKAINQVNANSDDLILSKNIAKEYDELSKSIFNRYVSAKWLNHPDNVQIDKITQLLLARKNGLKIPITAIVNKKEDLIVFKKEYKSVITKPLAAVIHKRKSNKSFLNYTRIITNDEIKTVEDFFYPTLIQEEVIKEYEIRSFYLNERFYSMAIFSQSDKQTSLDFRHYNIKKPNRRVSFQLPADIEERLNLLMKEMKMNSGSIDLIKNKDGEFIFLEVNPLGQLGMVSFPCNYHLEKQIAEFLIQSCNGQYQKK